MTTTRDIYVCVICEGVNIEERAWVDVNDPTNVIETVEDSGEIWCRDCEASTTCKLQEQENKEKI